MVDNINLAQFTNIMFFCKACWQLKGRLHHELSGCGWHQLLHATSDGNSCFIQTLCYLTSLFLNISSQNWLNTSGPAATFYKKESVPHVWNTEWGRFEHTRRGGKAKYFGRFFRFTDPNILFSMSNMQRNNNWLVSVGFCCTFAKLSKPQKSTDSTIWLNKKTKRSKFD